jgi:hypothetical protein
MLAFKISDKDRILALKYHATSQQSAVAPSTNTPYVIRKILDARANEGCYGVLNK